MIRLTIIETGLDTLKKEPSQANAHLIAAAPELYEIGRKAYRAMASGNITDQLLDELNSVLNKAEGRK